jgi:L-2-hydroxycarboxylate dehydrogenase (NAD+)
MTAAGVYLVDGGGTFGQVAADWGANLVIEGVREGKLRVASIRNTNHCGMLAYYTEKIAQQGGIAFMACNTNPNVAAFGGTEKVLGTNPFSIAAPCGAESIVIDMATSSVAKGKIYEYDKKGMPIPVDWALDGAGNPTTDAKAALQGALLPFAGHKGYAISLAVEVLAGVVSGAGYSDTVKSLHNNAADVQDVGIFLMGIPITAFMPFEEYNGRILDLAEKIKGSNRSGGSVYLPGELEHRLRLERMRNGIEVDDDIIRLLMTDGEE